MTHDPHPSPAGSGAGGPPAAVLICGAPGSGKSTVGTLVARGLRAALLDLDTATAPLVAVIGGPGGTPDLDDPRFARLTRTARYETLTALAEDNLAIGTSTVLVAPFTQERRDPRAWAALRGRLDRWGADPTLVWLNLPRDQVLARVEQRGAARDVAKVAGDWVATLDLGPPTVPHLEVDALMHPDDIADAVLASLSRLPGEGPS